ncbi:aminoacyltransferase [Streptococcus parauberis]|uniref:aminoacyltransferase n=1 Tax=Streptococcus parauberis TaxID=1348 RepID=UPI00020CC01C|nr:aminoacyltransferase [Streptococcus parauberis]AEF24862.1 peptidoglycan pentaglycine interpeptide biosynthesis protein [Streptococcus parauberis KCTC 11537]EMF49442.1 tRNA-dependent lipid II--L-alanine ligase [Streptococcus parauberis KRS-02109]OHY30090.1 UDP-N-acetylmuramoylpentapeptide-lysine N(6)-alanyltransferase [Streptococcus parauberis]PIA84057.1 Lipid II:glycine glycyltransferase [Streptococcus parauberis]UWM87588.1 aminoacyltransferase [Streptococcus parauberis]
MYTYKIGISEKEHDEFLLNNKQCNLLQSSNWAGIKSNWSTERIGFYEDDQLVATASLLIKNLPMNFTLIYIPRGPIMDYTDYELVDFVISSLKEFGKSKRAIFVKFDPSLFLTRYLVTTEPETNEEEDEVTITLIKFLTRLGVEWTGRTRDIGQTIQPRIQANIHAKNADFQLLPKKTKQAIRTAQNKGIDLTIGGPELLEDFATLMKKTEDRKGINLRGIDYYRKLMDTYPDDSYITMTSLDLVKRQRELTNQLEQAKLAKSKFTDKTKPGKIKETENAIDRFTGEINFLNEHIQTGVTTAPLAGTLTIVYGKTSENLYAGMDETFRNYQAALLTWYETGQEAFKRGCAWHNLGGVENNLDGGLYQFKSKLNPTLEEFAGEFNIPVSPLHGPAMLAYNLRKQIRSKH